MRNLVFILCVILLISCESDDDIATGQEGNFLEITIDETTPTSGTISWTVPSQSSGLSPKYQVFLNGTEVANNYSSRSYSFTNLTFESDYNVAVYALDTAGNSTFAEASFTTLRNPVGGHIVLSNQTDIENFDYEEIISLTLVGAGVTDISNLSILQRVRGNLTISSTSLTSLQGLENVIDPNPADFSYFPELYIRNNSLLEDINALSAYTGGVRKLVITNNPQLSNLSNLNINDFMRVLTLKDFPATNFSNFSTLEFCDDIILDNISPNILTSLTSLGNVPGGMDIKNMDFQNLDGLANLTNLDALRLTNIPNVNNVNGIGDATFGLGYIVSGTPPPLNLTFLNDISGYFLSVSESTLTNLSILSSIDGSNISSLSIANNDNLQSLIGLESITSLFSLNISFNPQLLSFNGLNSFESTYAITIAGNASITNFSGFDSFDQFNYLRITNNTSLSSLDGAPNLTENNEPMGLELFINANTSLSDYCGIGPYVSANGIRPGEFGSLENYRITNNLYNPSLNQITSPSGCSQ